MESFFVSRQVSKRGGSIVVYKKNNGKNILYFFSSLSLNKAEYIYIQQMLQPDHNIAILMFSIILSKSCYLYQMAIGANMWSDLLYLLFMFICRYNNISDFLFQKRPIFPHSCATCSELPSIMSATILTFFQLSKILAVSVAEREGGGESRMWASALELAPNL